MTLKEGCPQRAQQALPSRRVWRGCGRDEVNQRVVRLDGERTEVAWCDVRAQGRSGQPIEHEAGPSCGVCERVSWSAAQHTPEGLMSCADLLKYQLVALLTCYGGTLGMGLQHVQHLCIIRVSLCIDCVAFVYHSCIIVHQLCINCVSFVYHLCMNCASIVYHSCINCVVAFVYHSCIAAFVCCVNTCMRAPCHQYT